MNQYLGLEVLGEVMKWPDERARAEFAWVELMSRLKYDEYRDFLAGVRFVESLVDWLQQFDQKDREAAYAFVRQRLVYVGPAELRHLVELTYPEAIRPYLINLVAQEHRIPSYRVWSTPASRLRYDELLRRSLFLGLSDGARTDAFRRSNVGTISNEQVGVNAQLDEEKWSDLLADLRKAHGALAKFEVVFLMDDFTASGTSLLRYDNGQWKGKLERFWKSVEQRVGELFEPAWRAVVYHYIGTAHARSELERRLSDAQQSKRDKTWFNSVEFLYATVVPEGTLLTAENCPNFASLVEAYYDPSIETDHSAVAGDPNVRWGFGQCALPIVLEHNTPNNSIALLWAESEGGNGQHAMRPLFRRRQRHI